MRIKSKILIYFLVIAMIFTSVQIVPTTIYAEEVISFSGNGEGTSVNPYVITSANELNEIRNNLSGYYVLGNDIDLASIGEWIPIGTEDEPFKGTLDGQGHSIENLAITSESWDFVGLFGYCDRDTASLRNIDLSDVNINIQRTITSNAWCVGAIAGIADNITNCSVSGNIRLEGTADNYLCIGGIVGEGNNTTKCINLANIEVENDSDTQCGGIVGSPITVFGSITNCINYGNVDVVNNFSFVDVGGITGEDGSIKGCINYGDISGTTSGNGWSTFASNSNVGGIVGATSAELYYCTNYGNITGYAQEGGGSYTGGIAGWVGYYGRGTVSHCFNLGEAIASTIQSKSDGEYIDGVAKRIAGNLISSNTDNCYSLNTTTVNRVIPVDDIGTSCANGESTTEAEMFEKVNESYVDESAIIKMTPENGAKEVVTNADSGKHDLILEFNDDVQLDSYGCINFYNLNTNSSYTFTYDGIEISGNKFIIKNVELPYNTRIGVSIDYGEITVGGKPFIGLMGKYEWIFCTGDETKDFFELEKDTNQFFHYGLLYKITKFPYKLQLYGDSTWNGVFQIYKYLHNEPYISETQGVCHGIALSMCYGDKGYIDFDKITSGATNYWEMGDPRNNIAMSDMIVYYHLTQLTSKGTATKMVDRNGWNVLSLENRLKTFLESLVNEAKASQEQKCPFVFSFKYLHNGEIEGHSVVVCGYNWNELLNSYEIKIYDENSYTGSSSGGYITMSISADYSSFDFADANALDGHYKIQDVWTSLSYYGIDKLYNDISIIRSMSTETADVDMAEKTTLQITAGKKFKLENANGDWLKYDGTNYIGTMTVYDCYSSGVNEEMIWNLTVDESSSFKLSEADDGCELICVIEEQEYAISADGADSIALMDDKVDVEGNEYNLSVAVQTDSCDVVHLKADVTDDVSMTIDNEIQMEFVGEAENISITTCDEAETDTQDINGIVDVIILDDTGNIISQIMLGDLNSDGKIKINDMLTMLHGISGSQILNESQQIASDIDKNDNVTVRDMLRIMHYISGASSTL